MECSDIFELVIRAFIIYLLGNIAQRFIRLKEDINRNLKEEEGGLVLMEVSLGGGSKKDSETNSLSQGFGREKDSSRLRLGYV